MPQRKQDPSDEGTPKAPRKTTAKRSAPAAGAKPPSGSGPPPELTRNPDADPVRLHREYVQQRLGGGALPTPEAYAQAVDEWQQLPGSLRLPAADVRAPEEPVPDERLRLGSEEPRQAVREEEEAPAATYDGPLPATDPGNDRVYYDRRS